MWFPVEGFRKSQGFFTHPSSTGLLIYSFHKDCFNLPYSRPLYVIRSPIFRTRLRPGLSLSRHGSKKIPIPSAFSILAVRVDIHNTRKRQSECAETRLGEPLYPVIGRVVIFKWKLFPNFFPPFILTTTPVLCRDIILETTNLRFWFVLPVLEVIPHRLSAIF